MKIYILFEKTTVGNGDCVRAVSTSRDKILKLLKEKRQEVIDEGVWTINDDYEDGFISYDSGGDLYQLDIETHETLK